ncbi:MAG TPA: radical SAM protein [Pyrinomonadaceae bacterium]|nr:radical SAM protein [Pyrinomonadaceae bacterium]
MLDDISWAGTIEKEKVQEDLLKLDCFALDDARTVARQLVKEVTLRIDKSRSGEVHIGNRSSEDRLVYFFQNGISRPLRKIIKPYAPKLERKRANLPRVVHVLLINVKSTGYPLITAPLALTTLGGYLKHVFPDRVIIDYLDLQLENELDSVRSFLELNQPDVIGLSVKVGGTEQMFDLLERLARPQAPSRPLIVVGNVVPTYAADEIHHRFPGVVCAIGRGELTIRSLVEHAASGHDVADLIKVPSCSHVIGNQIYEVEGLAFDLKDLGIPDWLTLFDRYSPNSYQEIWIEASRGCPQKRGGVGCSFCAIMPTAGSRDWRSRTETDVLAEIRILARCGVKHLRFADEEFMAGQTTSSLELAQQLLGFNQLLKTEEIRPPTFDFAIRVDDVVKRGKRESKQSERNLAHGSLHMSNNEVRKMALQTFKRAGLTQVYLGIESGSLEQLKRMYKAVLPKDNEAAIVVLRELGLQVAGGWIMIDPLMEGLQDLKENIAFIERNHLIPNAPKDDFITNPISRMRVLEGSPLVDQLRKRGLLGQRKSNLIEYDFAYKDKRIALLAMLLEQWEEAIAPFIYALKNLVALGVLEQSNDQEIGRLANYLFKFKALSFDLIKTMVEESIRHENSPGLRASLELILEDFRTRRKNVFSPLIRELNTGSLSFSGRRMQASVRESAELMNLSA